MTAMKKLFLFLNLFIPALLAAQPGNLSWDVTYGGNNDDVFHQVIEATNGYLVAVGETRSRTSGGTDGFLLIADFSTGGKIAEVRFGGSKDDMITDVVQTFEGHFLLAGYTESSGMGKGDAWLIKTDERGREIWRKEFGTTGRDLFQSLVLLPDGSVLAAGYKNDARSGDIWLAKIDEQQLIWEQELGHGQFEAVKSMALMPDGGAVLVGNSQKSSLSDKGNVYVLRTLPDGNQSWVKFYGERDWEEASDVIVTRDGGIAFCGLTTDRDGYGGLDMWLVKLSNTGFVQWKKNFGGKDDDLATSLIESPTGALTVGGGTQSHRSGARQYIGYLVRMDAGGMLQWEYHYGDNKEDLATDLQLLHDGSLVMAGRTASKGPGGNTGWLVRWGNPNPVLSGLKSDNILEYSQTKLHTSDGQLKPNDRTYLSFTLTNSTGMDLTGLQIRVNRQKTVAGLNFWESNYLSHLPKGEIREVRIPIMAMEQLETGESRLGVSIMAGNTQISQFETMVKSKMPVAATVEIGEHNWQESRTSDIHSLWVTLQNPGDFPAQDVSVKFDQPKGIKIMGGTIAQVGRIPAHGSHPVELKFERLPNAMALSVVCAVNINGREYRKTLDRVLNVASAVSMIITQPNQTTTDLKNIISEGNIYSIQMGVTTPAPVQQQSFTVYRNNQALDGSKMDEVDLSQSPTRDKQGHFKYVYETKVHLEPGENRVQVRIKTGEDQYESETMVIYYQPRQPNLHVLAIGPSHQDLRFTAKDATDFANAFRGQGGANKLFGKVLIRTLNTEADTEADRIREAVADLVYQHRNPAAGQRILPNDVLMVFVSSHGKNGQGGFLLLPSNYDPRYERTRTIDFQRDVVQELEKINCKKVVFIDACHSGAADSKSLTDVARADALTKLAAMHPGMSTLTSCRSNELSYEDPRWENGAFTEAILEGFANKACMDENGAYQADIDGNSILTLGELYDFLRRRVPNLIKTQKPNATTNQTPFMPENQLDRANMSIFAIGE